MIDNLSQKPLIISGSSRQDSNTNSYIRTVFGQTDSIQINLLDKHVAPYNYTNIYPENDGFVQITETIVQHQSIVFATPVYWYAMSGLMKTFFDRFSDLISIRKDVGRKLKGKSFSLLAVGFDPQMPEGFEIPFKLTTQYFDAHFVDMLYFSVDKNLDVNPSAERIIQFLENINKSLT